MKSNIGTINALIRITCGLTILSWTTAAWSRPHRNNAHIICAILASMKVAEGITRFCPLTKWITDSLPNSNNEQEIENEPDQQS